MHPWNTGYDKIAVLYTKRLGVVEQTGDTAKSVILRIVVRANPNWRGDDGVTIDA